MFMRSPEVVAATLDGRPFLLNVRTWVYLELNESGLRIWELLEGQQNTESLVDALRREFDVPADACARDVAELLAMLQSNEFVVSG